MITVLLIVHGLLAVALLGGITHQAFSVVPLAPSSDRRSFWARFRNVNAPAYVGPIVVLFVLTSLLGGVIYPHYRIYVRTLLEDMAMAKSNGVFEIKEHLVAVGLSVLPVYWLFWRAPLKPDDAAARRYLTWLLAFIIWWGFLVGHVLNNIKGLVP
jgi:hypothetical protein